MKNDSDHCDCVVTETSVQTCPLCLPVGAIEVMIENGRQLSMFDPAPELSPEAGVLACTRGDDTEGLVDPDPSETLAEIRREHPSF